MLCQHSQMTTTEDQTARQGIANMLKMQGNEHFKNKKYDLAIALYTSSLDAFETAAVLTNRALCKLELELYGGCIVDCTR